MLSAVALFLRYSDHRLGVQAFSPTGKTPIIKAQHYLTAFTANQMQCIGEIKPLTMQFERVKDNSPVFHSDIGKPQQVLYNTDKITRIKAIKCP